MSIVERTGASDTVAGRIRELEDILANRRIRLVELAAVANSPESAVWEEDLDEAIVKALHAVRDITEELMDERAALHQSFSRVIGALWVWPGSHASVQMRNDDAKTLLQFSERIPQEATIRGRFEVVTEAAGQ